MSSPSKASSAAQRLARRATISALAAVTLLGAGAAGLGHALGLGPDFVAKSMALFMAALLWLNIYLPHHLPRDRLGPANQLTLGRLALTALVGGFIGEGAGEPWSPAVLAAAVLLLDGVDGWLARRGGWSSAFGARFDMETDALLVMFMAVLAWQLEKAGAWVLLSGALRYLFVAAGVALPWMRASLPPSLRRKAACVAQVTLLLVVLMPPVGPPWSGWIAATGLTVLCYSFLIDVAWLWRRPRQAPEEVTDYEEGTRRHGPRGTWDPGAHPRPPARRAGRLGRG